MSELPLDQLLSDLSTGHAGNFDPVRYAFIQSLATRLNTSAHATNPLIAKKLRVSAQHYQAELSRHRGRANKVLKNLIGKFPEQANKGQTLFERCQFRQLEKLYDQLTLSSGVGRGARDLNRLNSLINARAGSEQSSENSPSFQELLHQQEEQLRPRPSTGDKSKAEKDQRELQSVKAFRESMRYDHIDRKIERAIGVSPANPGPHNPHMLAIKAMTHMQDLSPQYLRRLSTYVETLLWLEKNAARVDDSKSLSKTP